MNIQPIDSPISEFTCDALVIGIHKNLQLSGQLADIDRATDGMIQRLIDQEEVTGKRGDLVELLDPRNLKASRLLLVGLDEADSLDQKTAFQAAGHAAKHLAAKPRKRVAFYFGDDVPDDISSAAICGMMTGCQGQDLYRAEKKLNVPDQVFWYGVNQPAIDEGRLFGESANTVRRLVNEPPSVLIPSRFADDIRHLVEDCEIDVEVWDQERLAQERCGALLAVARASVNQPRLVILRYRGAGAGDPALALAGKGVTFDSGGLSLKPSDAMKTMKCDMAGAATVVGTMIAIAKLQLPVNVVGLVGLVENMIGGNAYKLGDVLTARSGKTIEVLNTDAEGRLVLADVLNVAGDEKPARILDLATLTGACLVALGTNVAGLMTNNQPLCDQLVDASKKTGEPVWQLPMFSEFGEQIESDVADIKNISEGRWGGAITAGKFLEHFVGEIPWVHIDIAGPSFREKPQAWIDAGGTGSMVRTLVELIRRLA